MLSIILVIFACCFVFERVVPGWQLPQVKTWPLRVILINCVQLCVILLAGHTWEVWLSSKSVFHLSQYVSAALGGFLAYFIATFIFYWWHRWRHESDILWRVFHQIHHSPQRLEVITSFYKHPIEMIVNSVIGSLLVYTLLGLSLEAGGAYTFCTALGEFFYHTNVKTPRWVGFIFQRPEMHRIHHQHDRHKNNYGDITWWDMLFGTYENPKEWIHTCGFDNVKEQQLIAMLACKDVYNLGVTKQSIIRRIALIVTIFAIAIVAAGEVLTRPAHSTIGLPPSDLPARSVVLRTPMNETVSGWLAQGKPSSGAVLLLHGVRADRRQMLGRAKFLNKLGYSVLLIDLPGHGESTGTRITFGVREAEGVEASLAHLRQEFPAEKIGIVGVSLGAASTVLTLSKGKSIAPDAVVLESMFPTITEAVSDRLELHLGRLGKSLTPLLIWQLPLRLGFNAEQLQPIADLPSLHLPILIASGSEDHHTTLDETKRIFQVANPPKELWVVEGAAHVDLHTFDPKTYQTRIADFLAKHLGNRSMRSKG